MKDTIELLHPSLISADPELTDKIDRLSRALLREIGWHYIVDLVWILRQLNEHHIPPGSKIVDAGAGNGVLQFLLAYSGYDVIAVDFASKRPPLPARLIFKIDKIEGDGSNFNHEYIRHIYRVSNLPNKLRRLSIWLRKKPFSIVDFLRAIKEVYGMKVSFGKITRYRADMTRMRELADASVDAVVSVSAVEHMEMDDVRLAVREFKRVLKKDAPIVVTTSASKDLDWFHENSRGWCFSLGTIQSMFQLPLPAVGGFENYDRILEAYRYSDTLKNRLSSLYYVSDQNGMPWGIWDPKYVPVGISTNNR
jgi:ubiquinone/menaquinone biosynthesis C-methylase UbiE